MFDREVDRVLSLRVTRVAWCPGCVLVLARCGSFARVTSAEKVARAYGLLVDYADCNQSMNNQEAREVGIFLRWVLRNFDRLRLGQFTKVLFHHAHESSWHQKSLSECLGRLMRERDYLWGRSFGEMYPHFIQHKLHDGRVMYGGIDLLEVIEKAIEGTSFGPVNKSNSKGLWISGQSTSFFLDSALIALKHTREDYETFLSNLPRTKAWFSTLSSVWKNANHFVGCAIERAWHVLYTNQSTIDYSMPLSLGVPVIFAYGTGTDYVVLKGKFPGEREV